VCGKASLAARSTSLDAIYSDERHCISDVKGKGGARTRGSRDYICDVCDMSFCIRQTLYQYLISEP
jgi:hypothetical protein